MIVVTGGSGFIGSNLIAELEARGEGDFILCDRFGTDEKWRNVAKRELALVVEPQRLVPFLDTQRSRVKMVYHMGAISATTERDVDLILQNNFIFSLTLWHWCAQYEVPFVYASSAATYGDGAEGFDDENSLEAMAKLRPLNAYGWSKLLFDRRVLRIVSQGGPRPPQWAGLKFFNVYGPNEYHKGDMQSVVAKSYPKAAAGEPVTLFRSHRPDYADGGQLRDFVSVRDCVKVMSWLLDHPEVSGVFNLGTGSARSFADLVGAVFAAVGKPTQIEFVDTPVSIREKYQYFTQAKMDRLREAGYTEPMLSLEEGVADYVQNYLSAADPYR